MDKSTFCECVLIMHYSDSTRSFLYEKVLKIHSNKLMHIIFIFSYSYIKFLLLIYILDYLFISYYKCNKLNNKRELISMAMQKEENRSITYEFWKYEYLLMAEERV